MKSYLFIMVLILSVFTIPLMATPSQDNTGENFLRISILEQEELVRTDFYISGSYEILAIKSAEIKQKWIPSNDKNKCKKISGYDVKSYYSADINNGGVRRNKSGRY